MVLIEPINIVSVRGHLVFYQKMDEQNVTKRRLLRGGVFTTTILETFLSCPFYRIYLWKGEIVIRSCDERWFSLKRLIDQSPYELIVIYKCEIGNEADVVVK